MARGRKPIRIPQELRDNLKHLRSLASGKAAERNLEDKTDLNPLEAVAWNAGIAGEASEHLDDAVRSARNAGASWPEIAVAIGQSGDPVSANRVKNRFFHRL